MAKNPAIYTWDEGERRYRDKFGRFVARTDVRSSLDEYLDNVVQDIRNHTEALQDGRIEISEWQTRMEGSIKRGHTAATAIAKGGWKQVDASDWGKTGQRIQFHYSKLRRFAMELESEDYPMDGRLMNRAEMYGLGPTSTYERILRQGDSDAGFRWEKRILHSSQSCDSCIRYYDMDWQPMGILPNIGEQCACLTRCRCSFERSRSENMPRRRKKNVFSYISDYLQLATKKGTKSGKSAKKKGGSSGRKSGGKANVGCGTGAGGFAKGNRCRMGGGGSGEKTGGPVSSKARDDAKSEQWMQYQTDKNGKVPKDSKLETKKGLPAKINVEKGPPRNVREQKAFDKATKEGKEAIVRTSKKSAWTNKTEKTKEFFHGEERIATVMATKDVSSVKPTMNGKPYDPGDHESTKGSKFTVVVEASNGGSLVVGRNSQRSAERVARSHVKDERKEHDKEKEIKLVKNHTKDNLVKDTVLGREGRSLLTIRVLTPKGSPVEDLKPKNNFDEAKCNQRRRIAALRDNVEAFPIQFHSSIPKVGRDFKLSNVYGKLPVNLRSVMLCINANPDVSGRKILQADDVYIHYIEAANNRFVGDRFMFLDATTLRNIAEKSESGIAFMNSHRTGGLSSPAELPYGRSFAGRYEEYTSGDQVFRRALIGVYMVKGQYPNGRFSPSTDSLHDGIESGTIADVSMGLGQGTAICDICGSELETGQCKHVPGTHAELSDEEKESQIARGVYEGKASYTLFNALPREVSAVYKGAVPGAGFRKSVALMNNSGFVRKYGPEVVSAYGSMFSGKQLTALKGGSKMDWKSLIGFLRASGEIDDSDLSGTVVPQVPVVPNQSVAEDASVKAERERLAAQSAELDARARNLDLTAFGVEADAFCAGLKTANKATPFELSSIRIGYVAAAMDDKYSPKLECGEFKVDSRLKVFKDSHSMRPVNNLTVEQIGDIPIPQPVVRPGETVLPGEVDPTPDSEKTSPERLAALCATTPEGRAGLAAFAAALSAKQQK